MDCLFCKIANGEIPSKTVYEDEIVKVFLDINPVSNGHLLIVPKKHFDNILDIDDNTLLHIRKITIKMYDLLKEKLNIEGLTLAENNGYGQAIKHFHLHLMPRYKDDDIDFRHSEEKVGNVDTIFNQLMN